MKTIWGKRYMNLRIFCSIFLLLFLSCENNPKNNIPVYSSKPKKEQIQIDKIDIIELITSFIWLSTSNGIKWQDIYQLKNIQWGSKETFKDKNKQYDFVLPGTVLVSIDDDPIMMDDEPHYWKITLYGDTQFITKIKIYSDMNSHELTESTLTQQFEHKQIHFEEKYRDITNSEILYLLYVGNKSIFLLQLISCGSAGCSIDISLLLTEKEYLSAVNTNHLVKSLD